MNFNENEKATNRFLLSTMYSILGAFCIYYLYRSSVSSRTVLMMPYFYWIFIIAGVLGTAWFAVRHFALKKGTLYHMGVFIVMAICGLFLQFYPKIPFFFYAYRKFVAVVIFIGVIYVYELVRYFVVAGKKVKKI